VDFTFYLRVHQNLKIPKKTLKQKNPENPQKEPPPPTSETKKPIETRPPPKNIFTKLIDVDLGVKFNPTIFFTSQIFGQPI
jgi:hypothetical protein